MMNPQKTHFLNEKFCKTLPILTIDIYLLDDHPNVRDLKQVLATPGSLEKAAGVRHWFLGVPHEGVLPVSEALGITPLHSVLTGDKNSKSLILHRNEWNYRISAVVMLQQTWCWNYVDPSYNNEVCITNVLQRS